MNPVGKARARVVNGHAYTPARTREAEDSIRAAWFAFGGGEIIPRGVAVRVTVSAYFTRPKSCPKSRVFPVVKPDADNILKLIDALNGLAWHDDSAVVEAHVYKYYASPGGGPGLNIRIEKVR